MKIPFLPILKWIGTTLLSAAVQEGAERIVRKRRRDDAVPVTRPMIPDPSAENPSD